MRAFQSCYTYGQRVGEGSAFVYLVAIQKHIRRLDARNNACVYSPNVRTQKHPGGKKRRTGVPGRRHRFGTQ